MKQHQQFDLSNYFGRMSTINCECFNDENPVSTNMRFFFFNKSVWKKKFDFIWLQTNESIQEVRARLLAIEYLNTAWTDSASKKKMMYHLLTAPNFARECNFKFRFRCCRCRRPY